MAERVLSSVQLYVVYNAMGTFPCTRDDGVLADCQLDHCRAYSHLHGSAVIHRHSADTLTDGQDSNLFNKLRFLLRECWDGDKCESHAQE